MRLTRLVLGERGALGEKKDMETVISAVQENSMTVRFKSSTGYSHVASGKLIGYGPSGIVIKLGTSYSVIAASGTKVDNFPESKWPEKRWTYSDYCR